MIRLTRATVTVGATGPDIWLNPALFRDIQGHEHGFCITMIDGSRHIVTDTPNEILTLIEQLAYDLRNGHVGIYQHLGEPM